MDGHRFCILKRVAIDRILNRDVWKNHAVAAHFNSEGHFLQDLSILVIEQIDSEEATCSYRRAKESYWMIQTLRLLAPEGLNLNQ